MMHWKRPWCWERLKAGGKGNNRGRDGWMASLTHWRWVWVNSWSGDGQGGLACCNPWGHKESDTTEQLNWTELNQKCGHKQSKAHIDYVRTQWRWLSVSQGKDPQMKPKLQHLISDFQPPELRENEFLLFKPHSPWSFVMAALAN